VAALPQRLGQPEIAVGIVGRELRIAAVRLRRLLEVASLALRVGEVVPGRRVLLAQLDGALEMQDGLLHLAPLEEGLALLRLRRRIYLRHDHDGDHLGRILQKEHRKPFGFQSTLRSMMVAMPIP
jgi:hypothetical protein